MNKVSTLLLILVIVLAVLVASGVIYFYSETAKLKNEISDQKTRLENLGNQILEKEQTISDLTAKVSEYEGDIDAKVEYLSKYSEYTDDTIGISFYYPKSWGEIIIDDEPTPGEEGIANRLLMLSTGVTDEKPDSYIFLHAATGESSDRGGYWGDAAMYITDLNYINTYCNEKENCTTSTNKNGITVVKYTNPEILHTPGSDPVSYIQYLIFNPNADFHGIMISGVNLEYNMTNIPDIEEGLEEVINTLKFQ